MRKFTFGERAIIIRIIDIHKKHPNLRIPIPIIYANSIELENCDYEKARKEAVKWIVQNYNQKSIYEAANLINVLEENGYLLIDKEYKKDLYDEEINAYTDYIKTMGEVGLKENNETDEFPLKRLFGRISPKLANMLLHQIYANALIFDSLIQLAEENFLTEEGQMLKQAQEQTRFAEYTLNEAKVQTKEVQLQTEMANVTLSEAKKQTQLAKESFDQTIIQSQKADKQLEIAIVQTKIARLTTIVAIVTMFMSSIPLVMNVVFQKKSVSTEQFDTLIEEIYKINTIHSDNYKLHKDDVLKLLNNKYEIVTTDTLNTIVVNKND